MTTCCPSSFSTTSSSIFLVAPFWSSADISIAGEVSYEVHNSGASSVSSDLIDQISQHISSQMRTTFFGKWMIVAEWSEVAQADGSSMIVSELVIAN